MDTKHTALKLSPAQRKVLEVMADGTALRREVRREIGAVYTMRYWDNGSRAPVPSDRTVGKLMGLGFVTELLDAPRQVVAVITPKGREALK